MKCELQLFRNDESLVITLWFLKNLAPLQRLRVRGASAKIGQKWTKELKLLFLVWFRHAEICQKFSSSSAPSQILELSTGNLAVAVVADSPLPTQRLHLCRLSDSTFALSMVQGGPALLTPAVAPAEAVLAVAGTQSVSERLPALARAGRLLDADRQWGGP